jgi:Transposase DDE domain
MPRERAMNRLEYGQFLLSSQTNYTQTYMADHHETLSHDEINRWMREERLPSRIVWERASKELVPSEKGYLIFDDTVLDKDYSHKMELVRRQYSGNAHGVIKGIGIVNCVYVNPDLGRHWIIDYRIFAPDFDGKSKIHHLLEMFDAVLVHKKLPFRGVLMDTWYATVAVMQHIHKRRKFFYCPLKKNRLVWDSARGQSLDSLEWNGEDLTKGRPIRLKGLDATVPVKLFSLVRSTTEREDIITNDLSLLSTQDAQDVIALRWKIEQFHREIQQTTGIERCQCRCHRAWRTHIAVAMFVWQRLEALAAQAKTTLYALKNGLLDEYMRQQLISPTYRFA